MQNDHIKRNTFYTFVFCLSDSESRYNAVRHLQIDPKCVKMLCALPPGKCVFRTASCSSAMLCQIDFVPPARSLDPVEYDTHDFVPAIEEEKQTKQIIEQLYKAATQHNAEIAEAKQSELEKLSLKLLALWAQQPYTPVARLANQLGNIHYMVMQKIREYLENRKLADFAEVRIGRTNKLLMQLSEQGYKVLHLEMPTGNKGRGKLVHRHYARWVKTFYERQDRNAYLEWVAPNTNHPVDIAVEFESHYEIFEICVSATDNLVSHVDVLEKNPDIKKLTIIMGTRTELAGIRKLIKDNLLLSRFANRIELDVIENYMEREEK